MANLTVSLLPAVQAEVDKLTQEALDRLQHELDRCMVERLGELLGTSYGNARAWLIFRVAIERGWSEADVEALLKDKG